MSLNSSHSIKYILFLIYLLLYISLNSITFSSSFSPNWAANNWVFSKAMNITLMWEFVWVYSRSQMFTKRSSDIPLYFSCDKKTTRKLLPNICRPLSKHLPHIEKTKQKLLRASVKKKRFVWQFIISIHFLYFIIVMNIFTFNSLMFEAKFESINTGKKTLKHQICSPKKTKTVYFYIAQPGWIYWSARPWRFAWEVGYIRHRSWRWNCRRH